MNRVVRIGCDATGDSMLPPVLQMGLVLAFATFFSLSPVPLAAQSLAAPPLAAQSLVAPPHPAQSLVAPPHPVRAPAASSGLADLFDVTWYDLDLDVDRARAALQQEIRGRVVIHGRAAMALDSIRLDLASNMVVSSVDKATGGTPLAFRHESDVLWIRLALAPQEEVQIAVSWTGTPVPTGFESWASGTRLGEPWYWTLSEPYGARSWWPADDHPADRADSARVRVRLPVPTRVGSNGLLTSHEEHGDGTATWEWTHGYPIAPYLISVAAGTYDVYEQRYERPDSLAAELGPLSLPVVHYAYAGSDAFEGIDAFSGWKRVLDVFPELEWWYGAYPYPDEKYGHAHVTFGGGMEHQTMSSMGNIGLNLVVHELAHQWFGNARTLGSWRDLWLNEGFATQAEILYLEARQPAFRSEYEFLLPLYRDRALRAEGTLTLQDTTHVASMFAFPRVYGKGFMVLRMLRTLLGDAAYRRALNAYMVEASRPATPDDFRRALEAESGLDLAPFFEAWIHTGWGHPEIDYDWQVVSGAGAWAVDLTVRQVQPLDASNIRAFFMPLPVRIALADGPAGATAFVDTLLTLTRETETFHIALPAEPVSVALDPERRALWVDAAAATFTTTEPAAREPLLEVFPNPARDIISVRVDAPGEVEIISMLGRVVLRQRLPPGTRRLDLSHLPSGTYAVRFGSRIRPFNLF